MSCSLEEPALPTLLGRKESVRKSYRRAHDTLNDELLIRRYESRIAVDDHKNAATFGSSVKEVKHIHAPKPRRAVAFNTSADRFGHIVDGSPGPAAYDLQRWPVVPRCRAQRKLKVMARPCEVQELKPVVLPDGKVLVPFQF
ncbi:unnamed protein product [Symbiodinium natans]|uniref:Uncharacterized protein n=1 Tax=Symbiodinium natans TaxID=878477 RepID=A0A812K4G5_9DINO|nr:unnamed protein product [Symbiodinium natans]